MSIEKINECNCQNIGLINDDWLCLECGEKVENPDKKDKPKRPKQDNSVKGDIFLNCRCCGVLIRPDWYSQIDKRYCQDCL